MWRSGKKCTQTSDDVVLMPVPTCVLLAGLPTPMMIFVQFLLSVVVEMIYVKVV